MSSHARDRRDARAVEILEARLFDQLRRAGYVISIDRECDARAVASVLTVQTKTLRNWRADLRGPQSRTVHGVAWYSLSGLAAWIIAEGRPVLELALPVAAGSAPEVSTDEQAERARCLGR